MSDGRSVVEAYARAVTDHDLAGLLGLFAEGAVLFNPLGTFTGTDELTGFYRDVVMAGQAQVSVGDVLEGVAAAGERVVMAEVTATSPLDASAGTAHALDVFRLDGEGRITSLEIYYR